MENPWPVRHEKIPQDTPQFNNKNYIYVIVHVYHSITLKTNSLDTTPAQYTMSRLLCSVQYMYMYSIYSNFLRVKRLPGLAAS